MRAARARGATAPRLSSRIKGAASAVLSGSFTFDRDAFRERLKGLLALRCCLSDYTKTALRLSAPCHEFAAAGAFAAACFAELETHEVVASAPRAWCAGARSSTRRRTCTLLLLFLGGCLF